LKNKVISGNSKGIACYYISKKKLKYNMIGVLKNFFKRCEDEFTRNGVIVSATAPYKLRKKIFKLL